MAKTAKRAAAGSAPALFQLILSVFLAVLLLLMWVLVSGGAL